MTLGFNEACFEAFEFPGAINRLRVRCTVCATPYLGDANVHAHVDLGGDIRIAALPSTCVKQLIARAAQSGNRGLV